MTINKTMCVSVCFWCSCAHGDVFSNENTITVGALFCGWDYEAFHSEVAQ